MARRQADNGMQPWPKDLAEYDPERWPNERAWRAARARVAKSLGRSGLAEVQAMALVRRGRNGRTMP